LLDDGGFGRLPLHRIDNAKQVDEDLSARIRVAVRHAAGLLRARKPSPDGGQSFCDGLVAGQLTGSLAAGDLQIGLRTVQRPAMRCQTTVAATIRSMRACEA